MSMQRPHLMLFLLAGTSIASAQVGATKPVLQAAPPPSVAPAPVAPASSAPVARPDLATPSAGTQTATPPANSVTPPGAAASSTTYVIGPGDAIEVAVFKEPSLSNPNIPVRPDGMISMALLGDLPAAGFTPMRLSTSITDRLKKYITDPKVTVTVLSVHPKEIYLLGEIQHVGPVALTPELTILQAIASAGGLTPYAKAKQVYILRVNEGKQTKLPFNYKQALKSGDMQGVVLKPGDTIVVP